MGAKESELYAGLSQAAKIRTAFDNGIGETIQRLKTAIADIRALPVSGIPGQLRTETSDTIEQLLSRLTAADFYEHAAEYSTSVTSLESAIAESATAMQTAQQNNVNAAKTTLQNLPQWKELTHDEQSKTLGGLDEHLVTAEPTMAGLKTLLNNEFALTSQTRETSQQVAKLGDDRIDERLKAIKQQNEEAGVKTLQDTIAVPTTIESSVDFETVRKSLAEAEQKAAGFSTYKFTVNVEG